jgi:phage terminase large subunit-like protein
MNRFSRWFCLLLLVSGVLRAEVVPDPVPPPKEDLYLPGVALTQGITEITGVAISPLLGVSSVGIWRYWKTPAAGRPSLPWYAQPWAWGTGLALLGLCFLKDSLGTAVPGLLKKPFDMVELFENKASALVASGAFVPLVAQEMAKHLEAERALAVPTASIAGLGFAGIDAAWLVVPVAVVAFLLVWVCSHAINVLIILSPFSTLDALLKLARTALLASVGLIYLIAPWLAAALCLVLIALAAWLAPAALRLAIFGARYAADILLPWRGRKRATPERPHAFTLGRVAGLPPRTGGRMVLLDDGSMAFRYRRWCVLDERTIPLPDGIRHVEKGLLSPALVHRAGPAELKLLLFLPRYRGHEESMVGHLNLHGVRDHSLARGFAAVKEWIAGMVRRKGGAGVPGIRA